MTYYFIVNNLYLSCTNQRKTIVSDSVNYHTAHFTLDNSWDGFNKTATFTNTKTKESVMVALDADDNCIIPFEPLESVGELDVCLKGNLNTTTFYTRMDVKVQILDSGKTDASTPLPPTQDVYDQILQIASDKYVDALVGDKIIHMEDWITATDIFSISGLFTPIIITNTSTTLRTGTFDDYLDRTSYAYNDFYMDYSLDGITPLRISATSESGASPTLRRINFRIETVNGNCVYEVRITSSSITIRRASGSISYRIHNLYLSFDDYFYYDYIIDGFTTKYQAWLYIEDSSKEFVRDISFKRYPLTNNGYIRLNFSQRPSGDLNVIHRALKTDKDLPYAIWMNTEGDVIYSDINPEPISDLVVTYDNHIPTVGQIKEYAYDVISDGWSELDERVTVLEEGGGTIGQDGTTFTPSVDEEGYLSWSNDGNKPNPQTVCIKGEQGEQGIQGIQGERGEQGSQGIQGERGEQGSQGIQGEQGIQGIQGERGEQGSTGVGISSILLTSSSGNIDTYTVTLTNGNTSTLTVTNGTVGECVTVTDSNAETANAGIMDYTIQPNILYIFPTLIELNLTFAEGTSGKINEYMFQVTADGTEGLTVSYPNEVTFGEQISGTANKTYEINVVNNKGLSVEW